MCQLMTTGMAVCMSALTDLRLSELRWNTNEYIKAKPTVITLQHSTSTPKPGGGHDFTKSSRLPQTFRLVRQGTFDGIEYSPNDEGMSRKFAYLIIGKHDAEVAVGDTWDDGDNNFKIDTVEPYNGYEVRALVTGYELEPEYG